MWKNQTNVCTFSDVDLLLVVEDLLTVHVNHLIHVGFLSINDYPARKGRHRVNRVRRLSGRTQSESFRKLKERIYKKKKQQQKAPP